MKYRYIENTKKTDELEEFLERNGLFLQKEYEWGYEVYDNAKLVACAFVQKHLLMMVAIEKEYRHSGLLQKLMLQIQETSILKNIDPIYMFTKKENTKSFQACGFFTVIAGEISMMSNDAAILKDKKVREYLLEEKWPYSYYFCKKKEEYESYKEKIKEEIRSEY